MIQIKPLDPTTITVSFLIDLYQDAGINRPLDDPDRLSRIIQHSNFFFAAYENDTLVGFARCLSDNAVICYIGDLIVRSGHRKQGIGQALIDYIQNYFGSGVTILLLASPDAMTYYTEHGFSQAHNAFQIVRTH